MFFLFSKSTSKQVKMYIFMHLKEVDGQQINQQICLKLCHMIILAINYHLVNKNPNIWSLSFIFIQSSSFKIKILKKMTDYGALLKRSSPQALRVFKFWTVAATRTN